MTVISRRAMYGCLALWLCVFVGCVRPSASTESVPRLGWALAIHGGAGSKPDASEPQLEAQYRAALTVALKLGAKILKGGGSALDAVEQAVALMEDEPLFNAGRGAVFNHRGGHELDASIMNGRDAACGAVAGVTTVKNPIHLARAVMEKTRHVLLAGPGAEAFAAEIGFAPVPNDYFATERRRQQWQRRRQQKAGEKGTVGAVALDANGDLAAATSTGGLTDKKFGRVGDSPIIGAGTYANNATCAVSATGTGEEFIRHNVAHSISARIEFGRATLQESVAAVVLGTLKPDDGGVIAVDKNGAIEAVYSTPAMLRGMADASGRFDVRVWN